MGILSADKGLCNGCGNCFENCPMDVFRMDEETNRAYVAYPQDCMVCYMCEDGCDTGAIILTHETVEKMSFPF